MRLTRHEEKMLHGELGEPTRKAMEFLCSYGDYFDAAEMVEIRHAYIFTGHEYNFGRRYLKELAEQEATFKANMLLGMTRIDRNQWKQLGVPEKIAKEEEEHIQTYLRMGAVAGLGFSYYSGLNLHFGEHEAISGSSNALISNSVYGARTNTEGPISALMAAIAGRVPVFGFHLEDNRRGNVLIDVQAKLEANTDWEALGYAIGGRFLRERENPIPVITNVGNPSFDQIEGMAEGLGGGQVLISLIHIPGVTPESPTYERAFRKEPPTSRITIETKDIRSVYEKFTGNAREVNLVALGTQLSIWEMRDIAMRLKGKKKHEKVNLWLFTQRPTKAMADASGYTQTIEAAGGTIICDTRLLYVLTPEISKTLGFHEVVTENVEIAGYAAGMMGLNATFRPLQECIEAALKGSVLI